MLNIGGSAFKNGINLYTDKVKVKCYYNKSGNIEIEVEDQSSKYVDANRNFFNKIKIYLLKIPFVRGIVKLVSLFSIIGFMIIDIARIMMKSLNSPKQDKLLIYSLVVGGIIITISCLIILVYFFSNIKSTLRFHGAEHKVINTYENNNLINLKNVLDASRISLDCGTVYAQFFIFFMVIFYIAIPYMTIVYLLTLSVSYELFSVDNPLEHWYSKYMYKFGVFSQKYLTTFEPTEYELVVAIECILSLLQDNEHNQFLKKTKNN